MIALFMASWCSDAAAELQWRRGRTPPRASTQDENAAVRQAAYDGRAKLRSVVVTGNDEPEAIRSAQLPADSQFEEELREPFGDADTQAAPPEAEPMQTPEPELPEFDATEQQPSEPTPTFAEPAAPQRPAVDPFADEEPLDGQEALLAAPDADEGREKAQQFCAQELTRMKASTLRDVALTIVVKGRAGTDFPYECAISDGTEYPGRCWPETAYMWKASALCHKPLYFENESLERYGHSWGPYVQPLVSGAHFFSRLPILPYEMGLEPPNECIYALGHYRPGSCAPYLIDPVPFTWRAALLEAGAVVGVAAVLP